MASPSSNIRNRRKEWPRSQSADERRAADQRCRREGGEGVWAPGEGVCCGGFDDGVVCCEQQTRRASGGECFERVAAHKPCSLN